MTQKAAAVAEITRAIAEYGPEAGPKVVRTRYPDVDRSTFWRWCEAAKAGAQAQAAALIRRTVPDIPAEVLPAVPAPAIVARRPAEARRNLDFMSKMEALYADAEKLRDYSAKIENGEEKIRNPTYFGQSIKLRSDLMERWIQAMQMLFDFEQMRSFFTIIIDEIAELAPETAAKIMERLDALNRERGFSAAGMF